MLLKTRGIVLHHLKYGDSGIILHVYTDKLGRQSFLTHISKSRKTTSRMSLFQPLCINEFDIYYKQSRDLQKIKELKSLVPLPRIQGDHVKRSIGLFIAEILYKSLREPEQNQVLFEFLLHSVQFLEEKEKGLANFHIRFMLQLSRFLGFYPNAQDFPGNTIFDLREGKFVDSLPPHPDYFESKLAEYLAGFLTNTDRAAPATSLTRAYRLELLEGLILYYRIHLEGMGEVKSFDILKEIFHE